MLYKAFRSSYNERKSPGMAMKGMKLAAILFFAVLWPLTAAFLVGSGLTRRGDVVLMKAPARKVTL